MVGIGCWMSETEVLRLRLEVAELRALVHQLADRIAVLEASEGFEVVPPASSASRGSPEGLQSSPNPFGLGSPSGYPRLLLPGRSGDFWAGQFAGKTVGRPEETRSLYHPEST